MRRDRRLLLAMLLFAASLILGAIQAWITKLYIEAAVLGRWERFAETFNVEAPASGPELFCFDYCAPELPFQFGWAGLAAFSAGGIMLAHAWWKPSI